MSTDSSIIRVCARRLALVLLVSFLTRAEALAQEVLHRWSGDTFGGAGEFGSAIGYLGDLTGDAVPEVGVGDPFRDGAGMVVVLDGATGQPLQIFEGAYVWFRLSVSQGVGDLDQDGVRDFVLGAPGASVTAAGQGAAYVISGRDWSEIRVHLGSTGADLGTCIAGMDDADVDGDGVADYAIGSPRYDGSGPSSGRVQVFSGASGTRLYYILGESSYDSLGRALEWIDDIDGDGARDLVVSAQLNEVREDSQGRVHAFSGASGTLIWQVEGERRFQSLGRSLAVLGDIDGDGFSDVLAGMAGLDPQHATILSGLDGTELLRLDEIRFDENFSDSVAAAGDVNGDGHQDFLISGAWSDVRATNAGAVYLYSGRTLDLLYSFYHDQEGEFFGREVRSCGDLNGDGLDDFAVGIPRAEVNGVVVGATWVYAGNDLYLQASAPTAQAGETLHFDTRGGEPAEPVVLALVELDGAGMFRILDQGVLDPYGTDRFTATVPPGLQGLEVGLQSFSRRPLRTGSWIDSAVERVELQ